MKQTRKIESRLLQVSLAAERGLTTSSDCYLKFVYARSSHRKVSELGEYSPVGEQWSLFGVISPFMEGLHTYFSPAKSAKVCMREYKRLLKVAMSMLRACLVSGRRQDFFAHSHDGQSTFVNVDLEHMVCVLVFTDATRESVSYQGNRVCVLVDMESWRVYGSNQQGVLP